jgi:hypothetical protein
MGVSADVGSEGTGGGCRKMITKGALIEQCGAEIVDGVCAKGHPVG